MGLQYACTRRVCDGRGLPWSLFLSLALLAGCCCGIAHTSSTQLWAERQQECSREEQEGGGNKTLAVAPRCLSSNPSCVRILEESWARHDKMLKWMCTGNYTYNTICPKEFKELYYVHCEIGWNKVLMHRIPTLESRGCFTFRGPANAVLLGGKSRSWEHRREHWSLWISSCD